MRKLQMVEVRDDVIWIKHIHGTKKLKAILTSLEEGDVVRLKVDFFKGHWVKMQNNPNGRPTPGIRPIGNAKTRWKDLQAKHGDLVTIEEWS